MYTQPMIFPLDSSGNIYALQDEKGYLVGTGSREVCEVLMNIIKTPMAPVASERPSALTGPNVRAAIAI
ncbi:MAG: hypothetical protein ABR555_12155 [Pyrinomonadaceae bacterium]